MAPPLEHHYIGLTGASSMVSSSSASSTVSTVDEKKDDLNFKETELRLGLPGSESPERKAGPGLALFGNDLEEEAKNGCSLSLVKNLVSRAKRGFSDAIDGSDKWVFSMGAGSELDLCTGLFSRRDGKCCLEGSNAQESCLPGSSTKLVAVAPSQIPAQEKKSKVSVNHHGSAPASKAQVVGWPPIRSFRKNTMATNLCKSSEDEGRKADPGCLLVKVRMEGAPYLRKVDLRTYSNYVELSSALENMFSSFTIGQCSSHGIQGHDGLSESGLMDLLHRSEYVLTYEDKDGDWMLVGDVPWQMFTESCKRLRIMKGSEAIGLAPRAMDKHKNHD